MISVDDNHLYKPEVISIILNIEKHLHHHHNYLFYSALTGFTGSIFFYIASDV